MAYIVADRVKETTTVTGTGPATLLGAVSGYRTFASALSIGDTCAYAIVNANASEWEVGIGTYSAANTLTRTTIQASTNSNAAVVFTAGTKDVFLSPTANTVLSNVTSTDGTVTLAKTGSIVDLSVAVAAAATNVVVQVRNNTGATLTKGTVVYINDAIGQIPTVAKALATSDNTSAQTLGLMSADLDNNSNGFVTIIGLITDINTQAYNDGDQLYLSDSVAGTFTNVKPLSPSHLVYVGVVEYKNPSNGKIFVKVQNGYELDELHDVSAQNPSNGQTIVYNSTNQLWEKNTVSLTAGVNGTLPVANGGTGVTTATGSGSVVLSTTPTLVTPQTNAINAVPVGSGAGNSLTLTAGSGVGTGAGGSLYFHPGVQATSGGNGVMVITNPDASGTSNSPIFAVRFADTNLSYQIAFTVCYPGKTGLWLTGANALYAGCTGVNNSDGGAMVSSSQISIRGDNGKIGFPASTDPAGTLDAYFTRDAAGVLAQRNSTNAQAFRLYNTYTSASVYERASLSWASNICTLTTESTTTGAGRNLVVSAGNGVTTGAGGNVTITAGSGSGVGAGGNIILQPGAQGTSGGNGKIRINDTAGVDTGFNFTRGFAGYPTLDQSRLYLRAANDNNQVIEFRADTGAGNLSLGPTGSQVSLGGNNTNYVGIKERSNSGTLAVISSSGSVGGSLSFVSSTTAIATNTNDLALPASAFQRLNCTVASSLTGIAPVTGTGSVHVDGRMIRIYNVGAANLTLAHNNASSTAANRFFNSTGADIVLSTHQYVELIYDSTDNGRGGAGWRVSSIH